MLSEAERLKIFWASTPQNMRAIDTLQFKHPMFTSDECYWNESTVGTVLFEDSTPHQMTFANFEFVPSEMNGMYVDGSVKFDLTDIQDIFREKLESIPVETVQELKVIYRMYLSDTLDVIEAQQEFICTGIDYTVEGAVIKISEPRPNLTYTGELYTPFEIPMLRALV